MSSLTSFDDLLKSGPSIHHQSKDGETEVKTESNKDSDEDSNKDQSIKDDDIDEYTDALDAPDSPPPHFNTLIELELSHDSNVIPDSDNGGSSSPASATTIQQQPVFPHLPPNPTQPNFDSLDYLESIESNDDSDDNDLIKGSIASISRPNLTAWASRRKHFFVLSSAGKPIYARHGSESEVTELMGVFQTIIAFFEHDIDDADGSGDVLQSFTAGSHLFCFKIVGPLYLVGVSSIGESETELQKQLTKLHAQILSTTTLTQITRIFAKRQNYDLRLLLTGTDTFLHKTTTNFRRTSSIDATPVCAMPPKLRARLHKTMSVSNTPPKHVIYSILTTPTTILAIHRPSSKTPLLDPADVIILHTLIQSNLASFKTGIEVWTPLCLPRYNSSVFLNAYVCCLVSSTGPDASSSVVGGGGIGDSRGLGSSRNAGHPQDRYHANEDVFCVVMSTEREGFFGVSEYKAGIVSTLELKMSFDPLEDAIHAFPPRIRDLQMQLYSSPPSAVRLIRHFLCRVKRSRQYTECKAAPPYTCSVDYERLLLLYQLLYSKLYPTDGSRPAKVVFIRASGEAVMAMTTNSYNVFAAFHPLIAKRDAEEDLTALYRWCKKNDGMLFSE